jgi:hypothetical protein
VGDLRSRLLLAQASEVFADDDADAQREILGREVRGEPTPGSLCGGPAYAARIHCDDHLGV